MKTICAYNLYIFKSVVTSRITLDLIIQNYLLETTSKNIIKQKKTKILLNQALLEHCPLPYFIKTFPDTSTLTNIERRVLISRECNIFFAFGIFCVYLQAENPCPGANILKFNKQ